MVATILVILISLIVLPFIYNYYLKVQEEKRELEEKKREEQERKRREKERKRAEEEKKRREEEERRKAEEERKRLEFEKKLRAAKSKLTKYCNKLFQEIDNNYLNYTKYIRLRAEAKEEWNELKEFHKYLKEGYERFHSFLTKSKFIDEHNEDFIKNEKKKYEKYFKDLDEKHFWLTERQLEAVFTNEDATLINAWAWTGKTKTIENKIIYLHAIKQIPLNKILVITYSKASQLDMLWRISNTLRLAWIHVDDEELKRTVSTFHAFGKRIIDEYCSLYWSLSDEEKFIGKWFVWKKVIDENEQIEIIKLVLDRMKKKPEIQKLIDKYLLYYNAP